MYLNITGMMRILYALAFKRPINAHNMFYMFVNLVDSLTIERNCGFDLILKYTETKNKKFRCYLYDNFENS